MAWRNREQKTQRQKIEEALKELKWEWKMLKAELAIYRQYREESGLKKTEFEAKRETWIKARFKAIEEEGRNLKSQLAALGGENEEEKPLRQRLNEATLRIMNEEKSLVE